MILFNIFWESANLPLIHWQLIAINKKPENNKKFRNSTTKKIKLFIIIECVSNY